MKDGVLEPAHRDRLDQEFILWVTTVRPNGQPQTLPVWYVRHDDDLLLWSKDGLRVKNLATNRLVSAHVNDKGGGDILSVEGVAEIVSEGGPASADDEYVRRYQPRMDRARWTWEWFDSVYKVPVRITPRKVRS